MKEFIRAYGKLAGLFAAAALVLSFLTGILARNPIGTVILRAVLLAVLFAGVGIGLQVVVRRFLPGLGDGKATPGGDADEAPASGSQVDIVLPEENPLAGAAHASPAPDGAALLEEDLGEAGPGGELGPGTDGDTLSPIGPDGAETPAEAEGTLEPEADQQGPSPAAGGLDSLPDIGGLEQPPAGRGPRSRPARKSFSGAAVDEALRRMVEDEDRPTLARAVQTMVKRDEKG
jgi:hypothetical protein